MQFFISYKIKLKTKKYHTVKTIPKSNIKIVETEGKVIPLKHKYMTTHFHDLVQAFQLK
jgi:hypothetical protein